MIDARNVLVTGGTGTLGRVVVPCLLRAGHQVRVMSRKAGSDVGGAPRVVGDLATGEGVVAALDGADTVLHLASNPLRAKRTDVEGTSKLVAAAGKLGVQHVVYLSIVGCDANPYPYYRAKAAVERIVLDGAVPGTVLRATQFHDFVPLLAKMLRVGPILLLPVGLRGQLVDLRDVSQRLLELVDGKPAGRVPDLGGPEPLDLREALTRWHEAVGRRMPRVVALPSVGGALKSFAAGTNLPGADADLGARSYQSWLAGLAVVMTSTAPRATAMHWDGPRLVLEVAVSAEPDGASAGLPSVQLSLSERSTDRLWDLHRVEWRRSPDAGTHWNATVVVDSAGALDGEPLTAGAWDVMTAGDGEGAEPLGSPELEPAILVRDGQVVIAYRNRADNLSVDVGGSIRSIAGSSLVDVPDVDLTGRPYDEGMTIRMRLPRLTASGTARVPSDLWLSKQLTFPGELVIDESGALWFEATGLWVPPGRYRIGGRFGDRGGWTRLDVEIEQAGGYQVLRR